MTRLPPPRAMYVPSGAHHLYAVLHDPAHEEQQDTAVIICPPFGSDEISSYRPRREWARRLAEAGYPTLRLSLPATGDSTGSARDPDLVEAWTAAIDSAARWLSSCTGAARVAVVGIELGGLLAYRAVSSGAPIDELILWGTPRCGRALVKRLCALSKLESAGFFEGLEAPPHSPDGDLEVAGFLLSPQTISELQSLDLTALALAHGSPKRALMLHCDSTAADQGVIGALERAGAAVTVAHGPGYGAMTVHPQRGVAPIEVIERMIAWLGDTAARRSARPSPSAMRTSIELPGFEVREAAISLDQPFGELSGVLAQPLGGATAPLCIVLLNAGSIRRIGPGRMWVEAARRWAAWGVPSLRLDVESVGDSDGAEHAYFEDAGFYITDRLPQVLAALDLLEQRGVASQFAVAGLCAGGYWAFHAALRDPRVSTALMVNTSRIVWDPGLAPARDFRRLMTQRPSLSKLRRAYSEGRVGTVSRWALAAPARRAGRLVAGAPDAMAERDALLERFEASGKRAMVLFSEGEAFEGELRRAGWLERLGRSPRVTLERVGARDHTLRPIWAQAQVHAALDRAVERELGRLPKGRSGPVAA